MSSIQSKEQYIIEMQQKCQEYSDLTEHIAKQRARLREIFSPKITIKLDGTCERIYPDNFLKMDAELKDMRDYIWNNIFDKDEGAFKAFCRSHE